MMPRIVGLAGPIRAGKSTVSHYLSNKYGYHLASNSEILRNILRKLELFESRENLSKLGDAIFEVLGNDIFARYRLAELEQQSPIVVDGIRYIEEVNLYKSCPGFILIGVIANDDVRYARAIGQSSSIKDGNPDIGAFKKLDMARSERYVPQILSKANVILENNSSIKDLCSRVDGALIPYPNSQI